MKQSASWLSLVMTLVTGSSVEAPPTPARRAMHGAILALGAPFGWLALRVAWVGVDPVAEVIEHLALYGYMTVGTMISYVLFSLRLSQSERRLHDANRDLSTLAVTDALTSLRNARFFQARFQEAVSAAARAGRPLSLVVLDIDHFKRVNDTHGHPVGDEVLVEVARRIHDAVRVSDTAARVGGEEFALILSETDVTAATEVAERVRHAICDHPISTAAGELGVTISAGVAGYEGDDHEAFYAAADAALYEAKASGRNRVCLAAVGRSS